MLPQGLRLARVRLRNIESGKAVAWTLARIREALPEQRQALAESLCKGTARMIPTNGRKTLSVGTGFNWNNWTVDLAYAHLWINSLDYGGTDAKGISPEVGITGGNSKDVSANIYMLSVGYTF